MALSGETTEQQDLTIAPKPYNYSTFSTTGIGGIDVGIYNPCAARIVLTMLEGGNSLVAGDTPAQAMTALTAFFSHRLTAMAQQGINLANVVLYNGTVMPRDPSSAYYTGNFTNANVTALNTLIYASVGSPITYTMPGGGTGTYSAGYKLWDVGNASTAIASQRAVIHSPDRTEPATTVVA